MTAPITPHGGPGLPPVPRQVAGTVELAVEPPAAMALQPLIDGQEFASSPTVGKLAAALAQAQSALENPERNKHVTVQMKAGGSFSYEYADLGAVLAVGRQPLSEAGLALVQLPLFDAGIVTVVTVLLHSSGEWIGCRLQGAAEGDGRMNAMQALGDRITYLRRYAASGITGIAQADADTTQLAGGSQGDGAGNGSRGQAPRGTPDAGAVMQTPQGRQARAKLDQIMFDMSSAEVQEIEHQLTRVVNPGQAHRLVEQAARKVAARKGAGAGNGSTAPAATAAREGNWWLGRPVVIGEEDGQKVYGALVAAGAGRPVPGDAIKVSMGRGKGRQRGWVVALHDEDDQGVTVTTRRMSREDEQKIEGVQA